MADSCETLAGRWFRNVQKNKWRIITGEAGTGKTSCSRALAQFCRQASLAAFENGNWGVSRQPSALMVEWLTIASPETCDDKEFDRFISEAGDASMIILDDIGTETDRFKTGIPTQRLCHLLNRIEFKFVWITTNRAPSTWSSTWDNRVEDRLLSAEHVEVNAPSWRSGSHK